MKISFVIPAYNEEAIIGQCLESVQRELASGVYDAEVVVVNNASTDHTKEIALSFPGVRVVDESIKGLVAARAAGFKATDGQIVANIDADVMLIPGWIEKVFAAFADERVVALSGPFIYYDLSIFSRALVKIFYYVGYGLHIFTHYVLGVGAMLQGGNFIIRRDAFEKVGGFDTSIAFYGEDTDVAKRLSKVGTIKWTFKLPVYTSGRRLKAEGIFYMSAKYTINHLWITFFGHPYTKKYIDIRPGKITEG
jgi:glycosyltransferase involved in cell wall biosynthesis